MPPDDKVIEEYTDDERQNIISIIQTVPFGSDLFSVNWPTWLTNRYNSEIIPFVRATSIVRPTSVNTQLRKLKQIRSLNMEPLKICFVMNSVLRTSQINNINWHEAAHSNLLSKSSSQMLDEPTSTPFGRAIGRVEGDIMMEIQP